MIKYQKRLNTRKNKRNRKQILRKNKTFSKNRKISGGYEEREMNEGAWVQVFFDEEEQQRIKDELEYLSKIRGNGKIVRSTEIRDRLFPFISKNAKENAAFEIQVILGRAYTGR
jgi:hypothetical protein